MNQYIPVEIGLPLQVETKLAPDRITAQLVGSEHGKYLIISLPSVHAADVKTLFAPGKQLVVRYIVEGTVLGFRTSVISIVFSPATLVFVAYPKQVSNMPLRKFPRIQCLLPSRLSSESGIVGGCVLDISKNGCRFSYRPLSDGIELFPDINKQVSVCMRLPGVSGELCVGGNLRSIQKNPDQPSLGIQFGEVMDPAREALHNYVEQILDLTSRSL